MKEFFQEIHQLCQAGQTCVLATIVGTKGSTPRKQGAKLLVYPDGSTRGSVGGGCVEAEVWQEAMGVMASGKPVVREFLLSDELAAESGLVCGGTMEILVEAIGGKENSLPLIKEILDALDGRKRVVLATLVRSPESPSAVGAKALMEEDGRILLGSPEILPQEDSARDVTLRALATGGPQLVSAGGAELFIEVFQSLDTLLIVGAGHIAKALSSVAKLLGFRIVVVDDRETFANRDRFPEADEVIAAPIVETVKNFPISASTYVVVATRGHQLDYEALREVVECPAAYIGVIGSKRKVNLIYRQLAADGVPPEKLRHVHIPVGLNLGAGTSEEIALSIMAEILMEKLGGDGKPLRLAPEVADKGRE